MLWRSQGTIAPNITVRTYHGYCTLGSLYFVFVLCKGMGGSGKSPLYNCAEQHYGSFIFPDLSFIDMYNTIHDNIIDQYIPLSNMITWQMWPYVDWQNTLEQHKNNLGQVTRMKYLHLGYLVHSMVNKRAVNLRNSQYSELWYKFQSY